MLHVVWPGSKISQRKRRAGHEVRNWGNWVLAPQGDGDPEVEADRPAGKTNTECMIRSWAKRAACHKKHVWHGVKIRIDRLCFGLGVLCCFLKNWQKSTKSSHTQIRLLSGSWAVLRVRPKRKAKAKKPREGPVGLTKVLLKHINTKSDQYSMTK